MVHQCMVVDSVHRVAITQNKKFIMIFQHAIFEVFDVVVAVAVVDLVVQHEDKLHMMKSLFAFSIQKTV